MEENISNESQTPTPSSIAPLDRWEILYDLDLRSWETLYHELPNQLKDKGYKMITLYTASLAVLPILSSSTFAVMKDYWKSGYAFGSICLGILLAITVTTLAIAIFHIVAATLKTREFHLFTPPEIRSHVENKIHDDLMIYRIVTKHLERITDHNHAMYDEMLKEMNRSLKLFFSAVVIGFILYFIVLIQEQFFSI